MTSRPTEREDAIYQRAFALGFMAGWNSGLEGNNGALKIQQDAAIEALKVLKNNDPGAPSD